jgi:hypothetical protein
MCIAVTNWSTETICLDAAAQGLDSLALAVYNLVCRRDFNAPGFCLINVGADIDSVAFRRLMVNLKIKMAAIYEQATGNTLVYISVGRFDQQNSTKPHLDGGPDESLIMLGYEPSEIESEIEISDYARSAADLGISPKEFMVHHNPMFRTGHELLRPYATRIRCFSRADFQIVIINNSSAAFDGKSWQGTLHTATVLDPDESKRRVINSMMIASAPIGAPDSISAADLQEFINTTLVRRRGYDKTNLEDDA